MASGTQKLFKFFLWVSLELLQIGRLVIQRLKVVVSVSNNVVKTYIVTIYSRNGFSFNDLINNLNFVCHCYYAGCRCCCSSSIFHGILYNG